MGDAQKWRLKTMQARADRFRARSLLVPCFYRWQNISYNIQHLNSLALEWTQQVEADLVYQSLGRWHHRTALSLAEREVVARRNDSLLRDAWETWYHRKYVLSLLSLIEADWKAGKRSLRQTACMRLICLERLWRFGKLRCKSKR